MGMKGCLSRLEIGWAYVKCMVSFAKRIIDVIDRARREVCPFEQGKHLGTAAEQYLMTPETLGDFQTQDLSVKPFGAVEVGHIKPEMIEGKKTHGFCSSILLLVYARVDLFLPYSAIRNPQSAIGTPPTYGRTLDDQPHFVVGAKHR